MVKTILLLMALNISATVFSQDKWLMKSSYLQNETPVLIFKPESYNERKAYPLTYLLHGYSENYTQWSNTIDCQAMADKYNMIIVCPEGFVSYYMDSPDDKGSQYESFFFQDLVPKVHRMLSIDKKNIFISGLSMGGYGALRYYILHPDYFNTAGSTSGAIDINYPLFKKVSLDFWGTARMTDDLDILFKDTTKWTDYSIVTLMEKHKFNKPFIFDCGTEDPLRISSLQLDEYVRKNHIPATFITQPGSHNTDYWHLSIQYHFIYFQQHLK